MFQKIITLITITLFFFTSYSPAWAEQKNLYTINNGFVDNMNFSIKKRVDSLNYYDNAQNASTGYIMVFASWLVMGLMTPIADSMNNTLVDFTLLISALDVTISFTTLFILSLLTFQGWALLFTPLLTGTMAFSGGFVTYYVFKRIINRDQNQISTKYIDDKNNSRNQNIESNNIIKIDLLDFKF